MIDNMFVMFRVRVSQQTVDILMGANCAPLFVSGRLFCTSIILEML
jgi:hypothetical protein